MNTDIKGKDSEAVAEVYRWAPAAWLKVTGEDAFAFLQGQFTNDLRRLPHGPVYGLWLNQKARVLADSFVAAAPTGGFWVGSYFSPAETIRERLEAYIVADDVTVDDQSNRWTGFWVPARDIAALTPAATTLGGMIFPGRRGVPGHELVVPTAAGATIEALFRGANELNGPEMERRRILGRIPAIPKDLGPGDLPNEGSLELEAISYTKGCYLGQEIIARLRSMGQIRRRLHLLRGTEAPTAWPAPLFQGDRRVGELRSVAQDGDTWVGLALLTLLQLQNAPMALRAEPGEPTWTIVP